MHKPTARFFVIPLGAIVTLASLSAQSPAPRAQHTVTPTPVREQVVDCSTRNPLDVCVLSLDTAR